MSWAATLGVFVWHGPEAVVNQHIFKVDSHIDARFHRYLLQSKLAELGRHTHGSGMVHITRKNFDSISVMVPPPVEQVRIADFIEDQFSRLDAAATYQKSTVQRIMLARIAFAQKAFASAEQRVPLGELLSLTIGGVWGEASGVEPLDVDVLRVTELRPGGRLDPSTAAHRSVTVSQLSRRKLQPGDLLLEKSGGGPRQPVGRVGMVGELVRNSVCSNFMQLMRPNPELVDPHYLHAFMNSFHEAGGTLPLQTASTNIRNLKTSEYLKILVPLPPVDTQRRRHQSLNDIYASLSRLHAEIDRAKKRAESLRSSILEHAMNGSFEKVRVEL